MAGSSFDANDLRLRVQSCFSLGEMRRLLLGWGASPADTEGDAGSLAQRVVRLGLKELGENELVRKLRAEKPLAEWPDPTETGDERWAGPASRTFAETKMEGTPATLDAAEAPAPSVAVPRPPSARPAGLVFLDIDDMRRREAPNRRWGLVAAAVAAGVLVVGGAFAAGLLLRSPSEQAAVAPSASEGAAVRSNGPGGKAATLLDAKLRQVAALCDLPEEPTPSVGVLMLAQEACGRDEITRQERARQRKRAEELGEAPDPAPYPDPVPDEPPPDAVPARDRLPPGVRFIPKPPAPPKVDPPPKKTTSCPDKCKRLRSECARSCGPEPSDASLYGAYASCTGRCVSQESQCRRSCL